MLFLFHVGYADELGEGEGFGFNMNIPLPKEINDNDFLHALEKAIE
jgi:Histone deacetylase domain.